MTTAVALASVQPFSPIMAGVLGSLGAGLLTAVGAAPLLVVRKLNDRAESILLGFAAGVMLAASFFSLIIPGIESLHATGQTKTFSTAIVSGCVMLGAAAIGLVNRYVAVDLGAIGHKHANIQRSRRLSLFLAAITLHNFPEGMAVGVTFGSGDYHAGIATALAIGLQNVPEGLATATALMALGYGRGIGFLGALASGLVEPVGGLIGVSAVVLAPALLPVGLGLAAGAMIYAVTAQVIPEMQAAANSTSDSSTVALMFGLVSMMFLDVAMVAPIDMAIGRV